jgi:hypothetical protein
MNISPEKLTRQQEMMINSAIENAKRSNLLFRVGSVIYNCGIEFVSGCNTHGDYIQDPMGVNHSVCAIHAEINACLSYYKKFLREKDKISQRDFKKLTLCVVRRNRCGSLRNAKPCMECTEFLKKWLPCKILYSTNDGFYQCKVKDLESDHLSFVQEKRRSAPKGVLSKFTQN